MALPRKLEQPILRYGILGGLSHIGREALSRVLKIQLVYRETKQVRGASSALRSLLVRCESEANNQAMLDEYCPDWRDRLRQGNFLICVVDEERMAGFGWGRWQHELGFTYVDSCLGLSQEIFYIYDCYTMAEHRGKGVYQVVLTSLAKVAREHPVYVACRWNNTGSIRGIGKAGFMLDRIFVCFEVMGLRLRFNY